MGVAAFGDVALAPSLTGTVLCGHQPQVRHHLARMSKTMYFSQFAHHDHGRYGLKTFHRHEGEGGGGGGGAQVTFMRCAPTAFALVTIPMTQQEPF